MKISKRLAAAIAGARAALETRNKIRELKAQTESEITTTEAEVKVLQERLAEEQITAALDDPAAFKKSKTHSELAAAREGLDLARARVVGLDRRLISTEDDLLTAEGELHAASSEFKEQALRDFHNESYAPALEAYAAACRKAWALCSALGVYPYSLTELELPQEIIGSDRKIRINPGRLGARGVEQADVPPVERDLSEVAETSRVAQIERRAIEGRRMAEHAREQRNRTEAEPQRAAVHVTW